MALVNNKNKQFAAELMWRHHMHYSGAVSSLERLKSRSKSNFQFNKNSIDDEGVKMCCAVLSMKFIKMKVQKAVNDEINKIILQ